MSFMVISKKTGGNIERQSLGESLQIDKARQRRRYYSGGAKP
jgi:hypothetical protein